MNTFEYLEHLSNSYKNAVDELSKEYTAEEARDGRYNDEIKAQRHRDRLPEYDQRITALANEAATKAAPEIDRLKEALHRYVNMS